MKDLFGIHFFIVISSSGGLSLKFKSGKFFKAVIRTALYIQKHIPDDDKNLRKKDPGSYFIIIIEIIFLNLKRIK